MHDPRTGRALREPWDDDRYRSESSPPVDTRLGGRGYHYPGDARFPEAEARPEFRERRPMHSHENRSWDPHGGDEIWRRGEYGSRLYGNVVGAATPSGTAGIARYDRRGRERRGPKGYARSDERLRDDVCERLASEAWLDVSDVEVRVDGGLVSLDGEVPDRFSKYAIEDIADSCWGVKDVENRIRIRGRSQSPSRTGSTRPAGVMRDD